MAAGAWGLPSNGLTGGGPDLSPVAFCTGPSHAVSEVAQKPPDRLLPSESPFYFFLNVYV